MATAPSPVAKASVAPAKPAAPNMDPTKGQTVQALTLAPFQIVPITSAHRWIKCLFYGKFGVGKTSLAASAVDVAGMDDVLMVNAESGTVSVEEAEYIRNRQYIDQVRVTDFITVARVQEFLIAHCAARDKGQVKTLKALQFRAFGHPVELIDENAEDDQWDIVDEDYEEQPGELVRQDPLGVKRKLIVARLRRFRTVIVDSISEIDTLSMYKLLNIQTDMKLDAVAASDVAEWGEFRKNNQMMQLLIRAYRDLPMHCLMVTGEKYTQDEKKIFHYGPNMTGQLANQIQGFVDIVGYLTNGKPTEQAPEDVPRRLFVQPIDRFDAKCRISSYKKPYFDQPSMAKIMAAFKKSPS